MPGSWGDIVNGFTGNTDALQPPPQQDPNDFIAQQQQLARTQAAAQYLRGGVNAYSGPGQQGYMVSGHYIPNYVGMGQQAVSGLLTPAVQQQEMGQQMGLERAKLSAAQQAIQQAPQRYAPTQVDDQGNPIPASQQQSFPEYKQAMGQYAAQLLANPMTRDMGMNLANSISSGALDQQELARQDKLTMAKQALESKQLLMAMATQGKIDVANIGLQGKQYAADLGAVQKLVSSGMMDPTKRSQAENALAAETTREAKPYGTQIDEATELHSLIDDATKNGLNPANSNLIIDRFQRMANPGASVKESQYHRIQTLMPGVDALMLKVQGVVNGTVQMTPELAQQLGKAADVFTQDAKQNLYTITTNKAKQAQENFMDPTHVVANENWRDPGQKDSYVAKDPTQLLQERLGALKGYMGGGGGQTSSTGTATPGVPAPTTDHGASTVVPGGSPMPTSFKDEAWDDAEKKVAPQSADMLQAIRLRGEKSNSDQVSSAGARTPYQITPENRANIMKQDGYDPWASPENAVRAADRIWKESLARAGGDKAKALDLYSGGATGYATRVLGQTAKAQAEVASKTSPVTSQPAATATAAPSTQVATNTPPAQSTAPMSWADYKKSKGIQ